MEKRITAFPGALNRWRCLAYAVLAACVLSCAGCAIVQPPDCCLDCTFYPSAAVLAYPDGGCMLVDFGQGITPEVMRRTRQELIGQDIAYRLFALLGWRPRIDWIIITPERGVWDYKFIDIINSFHVGGIYFPYNVRAPGVAEPKMTRMLLQVSLSGFPVYDLTQADINLYQSSNGARLQQLLPLKTTADTATADEKTGICLRIDYKKIRILIASRLTQQQQNLLVTGSAADLKADIFYHPPDVTPEFLAAVSPAWDIAFNSGITKLSTNGERVRVEEQHHD